MVELKHPERFEEFWNAFPRKRAKLAAMKAYAKALKLTTAAKILDSAKRYAADRAGQDPTFTRHAATWLNAGCWSDYDTDLTKIGRRKDLECPRCGESDQRSIGLNKCRLCDCEFQVGKPFEARVYVPFNRRDAWDAYGREHGKTYPRDRHGGWWFPTPTPPSAATRSP